MKISHSVLIIASSVFSMAASAADTAGIVQRNVNQQERIEQGLQSGALTTKEAAHLEREESKVEKMESKALKDGKLTNAEQNRIDKAQDKVSRDIYREKHDAQTGNPNSASSQRMQANAKRNVNQQQRIEQGVRSGQLTNQEVAKLERGQARANRSEAKAGSDGHVGPREQHHIQHRENNQSERIYKQKHDAQTRQ